jgi:CheY-specific phosphatase CheX
MIHMMMGYEPEILGDLEISALFETANIVSGSISHQLAEERGVVCDISAPYGIQRPTITPDETVALDTGLGIIEVDISVH